jgi:hypothetical protein
VLHLPESLIPVSEAAEQVPLAFRSRQCQHNFERRAPDKCQNAVVASAAQLLTLVAEDAKSEVQRAWSIWKPCSRSVRAADGARGFRLVQQRQSPQLHFLKSEARLGMQGLPAADDR